MGSEKELEPGGHDEDATHVVQATDGLGRDPFKSHVEAEAHAAKLKAAGHTVEIFRLTPLSETR